MKNKKLIITSIALFALGIITAEAKEINIHCDLDKKDWGVDLTIDPDNMTATKSVGGYVDSNYDLQKTPTEYRLISGSEEMIINRSTLNFTYGFKIFGTVMKDLGKCHIVETKNKI